MRHVIDGFHVDREHAIERRLIDVEHPLVAVRRAGVVDDDVRWAEGVDAGLHSRAHVGAFGYVALLRLRVRAQRRSDRLRLGTVQIGDEHLRALGDEELGDTLAETAGCAGNNCDLALKLSHFVQPLAN